MRRIANYHRPSTIEEAITLLERPERNSSVIAGGTLVSTGLGSQPDEVVDLQALGLSGATVAGTAVSYGAMTRLQEVADDPNVPQTMRLLAVAEAPSTLRNAATIGGTVASAGGESVLLAGLLAHDARIDVATSSGVASYPLTSVLDDRSVLARGIITRVTVETDGRAAWDRTGRTPADTPIVAVVGRRVGDRVVLAATGVAATPVIFELENLDRLDPPSDFRGSSGYRRHLAATLGARVTARLGGGA